MEKSDGTIKKLSRPVLTKNDIPYGAELIFNAGVCRFGGDAVLEESLDGDEVPECIGNCFLPILIQGFRIKGVLHHLS